MNSVSIQASKLTRATTRRGFLAGAVGMALLASRRASAQAIAQAPEVIFVVTNRQLPQDISATFDTTSVDAVMNTMADSVTCMSAHVSIDDSTFTVDQPCSSMKEFVQLIRAQSRQRSDTITLYVHGTATTLGRAIVDAALMQARITQESLVIPFCWPSLGNSMYAYFPDREALRRSNVHIVETLTALLHEFNVNVIGFSLGGQGVVEAFKSLRSDVLKNIKNVVFFAADQDRSIFDAEYGPIAASAGIRTTVYASSNDFAMEVSESSFVNGVPRIGNPKALSVRPEITTIDYTSVNPFTWRCVLPLSRYYLAECRGHTALFQSREIAADLYEVLAHNRRPEERYGLVEDRGPKGQKYFRMKEWQHIYRK